MKLIRTILTLLLGLGAFNVLSQEKNAYTVTFNEAGQITNELPSLVTSKDKVNFIVVGTEEAYESRILRTYTRFLETIKNLDVNESGSYKVLKQVNLDSLRHRRILWAVQAKMAEKMRDWLKDPTIQRIIEKKRNSGEDILNLEEFINRPDIPIISGLAIPDPFMMSNPRYIVDYSYSSVHNPQQIPCPGSLELAPDGSSCMWIFRSIGIDVSIKDQGALKLSFKLRLQNNYYKVLEEQLKAMPKLLAKMRIIDVDQEKRSIKAKIDPMKDQDTNSKSLFKWMDSRINGKEDKSAFTVLKTIYEGTIAGDNIASDLMSIDNNDFNSSLKDTARVRFMLLLSWLNRGTSLTMNPLSDGLPIDNKGIIGSKTEELSDSTQSLLVLNKKLELYENMLRPTGQTGYQNTNYDAQLKGYNEMLDLQKTVTKKIQKLTKEIADLSEQQGRNSKTQTDYKKNILSDSLFYSGFLNISEFEPSINHFGYRYMRHHDALNDYRHFDSRIQKEINEKQFLEAIGQNVDFKSKIIVKYTLVDAGTDVDFLGLQIPSSVAGGSAITSLEDIFAIYSDIQKLLLPYGNGIISLPLTPIADVSPNYISKTNVMPDADKIPAKGSYVFLDSATSKNLTVQSTSFAFRLNKLYRFRLKAGIAYSGLERRTYTLSTINTSTYTTSYAGVAPAFGVQIFTTPIDIQKSELFPVGLNPFVYVGYLFNDAPGNNFLFGGGLEVVSGFALTGGIHMGKSQKLFTEQGMLQTRERYKTGWFVSASFGLEAFKAIFNSAKNIANPFVK